MAKITRYDGEKTQVHSKTRYRRSWQGVRLWFPCGYYGVGSNSLSDEEIHAMIVREEEVIEKQNWPVI